MRKYRRQQEERKKERVKSPNETRGINMSQPGHPTNGVYMGHTENGLTQIKWVKAASPSLKQMG